MLCSPLPRPSDGLVSVVVVTAHPLRRAVQLAVALGPLAASAEFALPYPVVAPTLPLDDGLIAIAVVIPAPPHVPDEPHNPSLHVARRPLIGATLRIGPMPP